MRDAPTPLHVVHLIARLNEGGPARVLAALAHAVAPLGVRCTVLHGHCAGGEVDRSDLVQAAGATCIAIPDLGRRLHPWGDLRALGSTFAHFRDLRPDLIHTHTAKAGMIGRFLAPMLSVPCLHTYHGHVLHGYFTPGINAAITSLERLAAGPCWHQALTTSQWRELHQGAGIGRTARWLVLPVPVTPITVSAPRPRPRPTIGWLGRLVPIKDGDLWLETLRRLRRTHDVAGVLCGAGSERARLEQAGADLPLHFAGVVAPGDALAQMDVLLMTSRNEGQPLAAVEAAGAGIPVVAPAVGGLRDLAQQRLVIAAARTPEALAAACARALDCPRAWKDHARRQALALAPQALAPRYVELYRGITQRSGPEP